MMMDGTANTTATASFGDGRRRQPVAIDETRRRSHGNGNSNGNTDSSNNRLKRANRLLPDAVAASVVAVVAQHQHHHQMTEAAAAGDEFMGGGGGQQGKQRESRQRILPLFELLFRPDSSSASLRVANVQPGEPVVVRCAIPADSRRAFIPGTMALHKDGRKVGRVEDDGNSVSYPFVPWEDDINYGESMAAGLDGQHPKAHQQFRTLRRRHDKLKKKGRKNHHHQPKPILFHCSATLYPFEAKKRGRLPSANLFYQRSLMMAPAQPRLGTAIPCADDGDQTGGKLCKNGGKCVQMVEAAGTRRHCLCSRNFIGHFCEKPVATSGLIGTMSLPALCLSSISVLMLLLVVLLTLLLAREKRRTKRRRDGIRLDDKEEASIETPLEELYESADGICSRSAKTASSHLCSPNLSYSRIPRLYSAPQKTRKISQHQQQKGEAEPENGTASNSSNGYDNLEKLREEIGRQKAELEERRAQSAAAGQEAVVNRSNEHLLEQFLDGSASSNEGTVPVEKKATTVAYVNLAEQKFEENRITKI